MINLEYDAEKFLYKIQKWGSLNPDVKFLLYSINNSENDGNSDLNYIITAVVNDCLDLTRKLNWIDYFGKSKSHVLTEEGEKHVIDITYENGPKVQFVLFDSELPANEPSINHATILVDKQE